jgi:hypothetical protein
VTSGPTTPSWTSWWNWWGTRATSCGKIWIRNICLFTYLCIF